MIAVQPSARRCFIFALVFVSAILGVVGADAATYYVAKTGNDAISCATAQTIGSPKLTITNALNCLAAGDTLYIRAGTYAEAINDQLSTITPGTSWSNATKIWGYPGENPVLQPPSSIGANKVYFGFYISNDKNWYLHFKDFIVDGTNMIHESNGIPLNSPGALLVRLGASETSVAAFIRLENLEVRNAITSAIVVNGHDHEFLNLHVHHNGLVSQQLGYVPGANGIYNMSWNSKVIGGFYHDNRSFGVRHFTSFTNATGHDNITDGATFYTNGAGRAFGGTSDGGSVSGGTVMGDSNNVTRNSIFYDNGGFAIYLYNNTNNNNNAAYNNTLYNNDYGFNVATGANNAVIKNNLSIGNAISNYNNGEAGTIQAFNRLSGFITDCTVSTSDFHLKAGAPCIDAGTTIASVTTDFAGVKRPQGAAYDIGAYEGSGTGTAQLQAPQNLRVN
jgi:hypothetical protein